MGKNKMKRRHQRKRQIAITRNKEKGTGSSKGTRRRARPHSEALEREKRGRILQKRKGIDEKYRIEKERAQRGEGEKHNQIRRQKGAY